MNAQRLADDWNRMGDGVPCTYWPIRRDDGLGGDPLATHTRSLAWVTPAGKPVVMVRGKAGYVSLRHVRVRAE